MRLRRWMAPILLVALVAVALLALRLRAPAGLDDAEREAFSQAGQSSCVERVSEQVMLGAIHAAPPRVAAYCACAMLELTRTATPDDMRTLRPDAAGAPNPASAQMDQAARQCLRKLTDAD